ncbi:MAG: GNAT family N-acetyltransferase [Caldilineaceae bacterium]|nr:GNAT family N-acetyltransferase [Caldilineaceae bacterium]
MNVMVINQQSIYLNEVIRLADENSNTLGFMPRDAFSQHAQNGRILVALQDSEVLGYLLYGVNSKASLIYITHLCVDQKHRGSGVARALFEALVAKTRQDFRAIRVRCRRDYEVNKIWPKLGFHPPTEIPGRSQKGSLLTVWWFDFGHPTLFSYASETQTESLLHVVIDANIFFELQEPPNTTNQVSHSLQADWLDVRLCLTDEIFTEIDRGEEQYKRQKARNFTAEFNVVKSPSETFQKIERNLRDLFPRKMTERDGSDLRQIAKTIAAQVPFFVTQDENLLKKSDSVYERYEMRIVRPTDLIIHQDLLIRESEYRPAWLSGSRIQARRVSQEDSSRLEEAFQQKDRERKPEFRRTLQPFLADPRTHQVTVIEHGNQLLALVVYSRKQKDELEIPLIRIPNTPLASTLAIHLVNTFVVDCTQEKRSIVRVTDRLLSDTLTSALRENEFVLSDDQWVKVNLRMMKETSELTSVLHQLAENRPLLHNYFKQMFDWLHYCQHVSRDSHTILHLEKTLWPVKIADLNLPIYIVSIHPQWAMEMFDPYLADQTLFGANPFLMLNAENVYYRSSRSRLEAPARILWYITEGQGKRPLLGTKSIRACSYLDEVIIDKPKSLYSRFKRLGIYSWEHVLGVAKGDLEQDIMAFRFSKTELLNSPVDRNTVQQIWLDTVGKNFNIQGPIKISSDQFARIYQASL